MCGLSYPTELGPQPACWAICFGQPNVRGQGQSARRRQIRAKAESEWVPRLTTFQFLCRPCGRIEEDRDLLRPSFAAEREARHILGQEVRSSIPSRLVTIPLKSRGAIFTMSAEQAQQSWSRV